MRCHECARGMIEEVAVGQCSFCLVGLCKNHLVDSFRGGRRPTLCMRAPSRAGVCRSPRSAWRKRHPCAGVVCSRVAHPREIPPLAWRSAVHDEGAGRLLIDDAFAEKVAVNETRRSDWRHS
jgi:hypothetical protein